MRFDQVWKSLNGQNLGNFIWWILINSSQWCVWNILAYFSHLLSFVFVVVIVVVFVCGGGVGIVIFSGSDDNGTQLSTPRIIKGNKVWKWCSKHATHYYYNIVL